MVSNILAYLIVSGALVLGCYEEQDAICEGKVPEPDRDEFNCTPDEREDGHAGLGEECLGIFCCQGLVCEQPGLCVIDETCKQVEEACSDSAECCLGSSCISGECQRVQLFQCAAGGYQ